MVRGYRNIESWEAALIKAMLDDGTYTRDQIVAYFSRPDRTVNQFRINEIRDGKLYADIPPADPIQVRSFLRTYRSPKDAHHQFFEEDPLHPANLRSIFRIKEGSTNALRVDETDRIEFKQNLNFGSKSEYARVIVSFANACGGFLVFGVEDEKKRVTGIKDGRLASYDSAKLNQYLSEHFSPVPLWEKTELTLAGKTVGVIYARPAQAKPIICTKDDSKDLREAEIYYRYPGESRRIRHAELLQIIREASSRREDDWSQILQRVQEAGVENAAILNTLTGEVAGRTGKFVISEDLIPKVQFVNQGKFTESEGEPTLRLIGDVEPVKVTMNPSPEQAVKRLHITDADLTKDFLTQANVADPVSYIKHSAHSQKIWLPLFYYIRQAEISDKEAAHILHDEVTASKEHVTRLARRIEKREQPKGAPKPESVWSVRERIVNKTLKATENEEDCLAFAKGVRTLAPGEISTKYLLPHLIDCLARFSGSRTTEALRYAIAHVDVVLHEQVMEERAKKAKTKSKTAGA